MVSSEIICWVNIPIYLQTNGVKGANSDRVHLVPMIKKNVSN